MDFGLNNSLDLYKRLLPAINSKINELSKYEIFYVKREDIWNYLKQEKWKDDNISLAEMVDDILNTNSDYFRDYVLKRIEHNNMVSELPKTKDKYNELL